MYPFYRLLLLWISLYEMFFKHWYSSIFAVAFRDDFLSQIIFDQFLFWELFYSKLVLPSLTFIEWLYGFSLSSENLIFEDKYKKFKINVGTITCFRSAVCRISCSFQSCSPFHERNINSANNHKFILIILIYCFSGFLHSVFHSREKRIKTELNCTSPSQLVSKNESLLYYPIWYHWLIL